MYFHKQLLKTRYERFKRRHRLLNRQCSFEWRLQLEIAFMWFLDASTFTPMHFYSPVDMMLIWERRQSKEVAEVVEAIIMYIYVKT